MTETRSLLDLMPKEEAEKAIARGRRRYERQQSNKGAKISPEIYMLAEFGYYFGWQAVMAVRNNEITLDEMNVLLEGAKKVWYSKLVETGGVNTVAGSFKTQGSYESAMRPYIEKSEIG